jgi:Sulfatase
VQLEGSVVTTLAHASGRSIGQGGKVAFDDALPLVSAALAFVVALVTAGQHMALGDNLRVVLFVAFDAVLVMYLTVALGVCQRHRELGTVLATVIAVGLLTASCVKVLVLGESGFLADALLLPDLLHVLPPMLAWLGIGAGVLLAILYLGNLSVPRSRREALLIAPLLALILLAVAILALPGVAAFAAGALPVKARGFPVFGHFYTAYGAFVRDADWAHQMRALLGQDDAPIDQVPLGRASIPPFAPRNIHLVVVESLTDPAWYPGFGLEIPLPPTFERWRRDGSRALSPVFGNRSSNAEFELLCGLPSMVGPSEMVFRRVSAKPLPCLPRRLAAFGYRSISLVPSAAEIFNAGQAYAAIGFDQSLFDRDLDMSDLDGQFLSADATLAQHWKRLAARIGAGPLLSYVFINSSHYPYARNERRRPAPIRDGRAPAIFVDYVNAIHHVSLAIERFVDRVASVDPDALIVILGDHAPPLGANLSGYREGGRIAPDEPFALRKAALYEVPLLLLDRGELVPVGRLPTFQIPYLLLDRLSAGAYCRKNGCPWSGDWRYRPFRDMSIRVEARGTDEEVCERARPSTACERTLREARGWQVELLRVIGATAPAS